jgi:hypothetical protein
VGAGPSRDEIRGTFLALQATGVELGTALGLTAQVHGHEAAQFLWESWIRGAIATRTILVGADTIAKGSPEAANAWFNAWLAQKALATGRLDCQGMAWLTSLPDGLRVDGYLGLNETGLRSLPRGLRVEGNLTLFDAPAWDGRIPEDTEVGGTVYTEWGADGIPLGPTLAEWRARYPHGMQGGA